MRFVLRVDVLTKNQSFGLALVGLGLLITFLVIGLTGPKAAVKQYYSAYDCPEGSHLWTPVCTGVRMNQPGAVWTEEWGKFGWLNQYWALAAFPFNLEYEVESVKKELPMLVSIYGSNNLATWRLLANETNEYTLSCKKGEQECTGWWIAVQNFMKFDYYRVSVELLASEAKNVVGDMRFRLQTGNEEFNNMRLGFRVTWLLVSIMVLLWYLFTMRSRPWNLWVFEQKCLLWLLFGVCCYNDPFFSFSFMVDNPVFAIFGAILEAFFGGIVALFWLFYFDRMRRRRSQEQNRNWSPFTMYELPKYALVLCYVIFSLTLYCWVRVGQYDESVPGDEVPDGIVVLFYLSAISYAALLVWVIVLATMCFTTVATTPHVFKRFTFIAAPTIVVVFSIMTSVFSGSFGPYNRSLLQFIYFFGLWNLYVWFLAIGWWPYSGGFNVPNAKLPEDEDDSEDNDSDPSLDPLFEPSEATSLLVEPSPAAAAASSSSATSTPKSTTASTSSKAKVYYGGTKESGNDEPWANLPTEERDGGL